MGFVNRREIRRLRQGDPDACRRLIADHSSKVFAYMMWLGADRELAEDLTQETYAKAWRGVDALRDPGGWRGARTRRNTCRHLVHAGRPRPR